jgi:hypothetical protein
MKIPNYWIRHEGEVQRPDGQSLQLFAWGWSESSTAEAEAKARERFQSLEQRVREGLELPRGYAYGDRPVREQIVDRITGADGQLDALLTRNSYGAIVLNTSRAMFVDVDVEGDAGPSQPPPDLGFIGRLFGMSAPAPAAAGAGDDARLATLRSTLRSTRGSFRVYRTAAGYRLLAIDRPFTPASRDSESVMRAVGADPAFIQLCRIQESFRARLTPKPWRMDQTVPPGQFPRDASDEPAFTDWVRQYDRASESKATCRFVETVGSTAIDPLIAPIVQLHDARTKATSGLPLA